MFYVCKAGNVGIGTTAPAEKLTVAGSISARDAVCVAGAALVSTAGNQTIAGTKTFSGTGTFSGNPIRLLSTYVDALPSASPAGQRAFVQDPQYEFNSTYVGCNVSSGGSNFSPVYSDGSNWKQG